MADDPDGPAAAGTDGARPAPLGVIAKRAAVVMVVVTAVSLLAVILVWERDLLLLLLVAVFLACAIEPVAVALNRRGLRRPVAVGLVMVAATVGLVALGIAIGSLLVAQVSSLINALPQLLEQAAGELRRLGIQVTGASLGSGLVNRSGLTSVFGLGQSVLELLFEIFTVVVLTYYLAADGPKLRRAVCSLLPARYQRHVLRAWNMAISSAAGYFYLAGLLAGAAFTYHLVVFSVLGLPYWLLLALWVGVASQLVPGVGAVIAGILPVLVALSTGDRGSALWVVVAMVLYQGVESYVLQPRVGRRVLNLHPGLAFVAFVVFTGIFGLIGAVLSMPVVATGQAFVNAYVRRHDIVDSPLTEIRAPGKRR